MFAARPVFRLRPMFVAYVLGKGHLEGPGEEHAPLGLHLLDRSKVVEVLLRGTLAAWCWNLRGAIEDHLPLVGGNGGWKPNMCERGAISAWHIDGDKRTSAKSCEISVACCWCF